MSQWRLWSRALPQSRSLAALKEHQRGDGVDAETLDELRLLVVVDLASDERVGVLLPHFVEGRGNTAAVGAPLDPEIHQHGLVRVQDVIFKAVGRNGILKYNRYS